MRPRILHRIRTRHHAPVLAALTATALGSSLLAGCSLVGSENDGAGAGDDTVTLITHESFALPDELIEQFEEESGYALEITKLADAGAMTNQLVLTKDDPVGDVVFGVDNTFATRAVEEGVFAPYAATLPAGADAYALDGEGGEVLTPVDNGNVCVNIDSKWFAANDVPEPTTLEDLTKPAYADLFVLPGASTSSPGLAYLLATIGRYGEEWPGYWEDLMANGAKVVKGWSDAYYTDFTFSGGERPIVVSYDSSPAFTLNKAEDATTTKALLDGCFQQVEYAGVLRGDKPDETNVAGAEAVIDWLLSPEVQAALPESMYVFPVAADVELPPTWAAFTERPTTTEQVTPDEITERRAEWIEEWTEIVSR